MGIYKKGNNWYIDYYLRGQRKRRMVGPSKKLAEQVLDNVHVKIVKKDFLGLEDEKKIPFGEYAKEYLEYSKANKALATYQRQDRIWIGQLSIAFEGNYLSEIMPQMIEKYKAKRLAVVKPATINRELACLKHMYTKAIEWGYMKHNPAKGVKLLKEPPGRLRYLEPTEVEILLKACAEHIRPMVIMAVNTGMRKGEILNLKWTDVDLKNRKIAVIHSKNNEMRVIPMNTMLYQELSCMKQESQGEYVFPGNNGQPYEKIDTGFNGATRRAGIKNFRFHDLRHTFGSQLVMQGVDLRTVQQMMGHKDIKMTMRYSHLSPAHVQEAVNKLDKVWTPYGHHALKTTTQAPYKIL